VPTVTEEFEIRAATAGDWPKIYPFFAAIVAAGETYAYPDGLSSNEARTLWMEEPPGLTVVAVEGGTELGGTELGGTELGGTVLGSAKMGPNRPGRGAHIATGSFMVDPAYAGRGVGRALGAYLINWASRNGYHGIQFNAVVETNAAAVHLWQALGFRILGTVPEAFAHPTNGRVGLHVMYRKL
jgi:GNAT superfamily N-acetyltransferase